MFIISKAGYLITKIEGKTSAKPRETIRYSWQRCEEAINASREFNLVNAKYGRVSDAQKWHKAWDRMYGEERVDNGTACEINPGEFYIS